MKALVTLPFLLFLSACAIFGGGDAIDRRIGGFDRHGLWANGIFSPIRLPASSKPEEIIQAALEACGEKDAQWRILEIRKVKIGNLGSRIEYMAAIIKIQST
jgi:hypothetical protein